MLKRKAFGDDDRRTQASQGQPGRRARAPAPGRPRRRSIYREVIEFRRYTRDGEVRMFRATRTGSTGFSANVLRQARASWTRRRRCYWDGCLTAMRDDHRGDEHWRTHALRHARRSPTCCGRCGKLEEAERLGAEVVRREGSRPPGLFERPQSAARVPAAGSTAKHADGAGALPGGGGRAAPGAGDVCTKTSASTRGRRPACEGASRRDIAEALV